MVFVMLSHENLFSQISSLPIERVTLVTDRDLYISGETVWFTASCFLEKENESSPLSQILYIELFNANQKVFVQEKFKLTNGRVSGNIHIPEEIPTACYFIRAYTSYMRNFPPEHYFTIALTVVNPEYPVKQETLHEEIEVFLQQDMLLSNVPNKVVFRLPSINALNLQSAFIRDTTGVFTNPVTFYQNGLAFCTFIPADSSLYKICVVLKNNDTIAKLLPQPTNHGFLVEAIVAEQELRYKLLGSLPGNKVSDPFNIIIRSQDFVKLYDENLSGENLKKGISIPANQFTIGLNHVELRSSDNRLLNLQSIFIAQNPEINITPHISKQTYTPREQVEMVIATNGQAIPEIEFLQFSVVKKGSGTGISETLPGMLISNPQLLRDINSTSFDREISDQIYAALQIYAARIKETYDEVVSSSVSHFDYIPDIRDISVTGLVKDKKTQKPVEGIRLFASVMQEEFQLHSAKTSLDGRFAFSLPFLHGKYDVFLCPEFDTLQKIEILLNNDFSSQFTSLVDIAPDIDESARRLLEGMLLNQQVSLNFNNPNEVVSLPVTKVPAWFGNDMNTIVLADYIAFNTIREVFNEIVPQVRLKEQDGKYKLHVYDEQSEIYYEDPLVLLDGIPITDINILLQLYPAKVDRIEVLNRTFILGNLTIRGLVSVRTKTDNFGGVQLPEDVVFVNYQTRSAIAEFNPINLEADTTLQQPMPLFKNLLYFNSFYSLSEIPEKISFYASDHVSDYEIVIKGKTLDGRWINGRSEFKVVDH